MTREEAAEEIEHALRFAGAPDPSTRALQLAAHALRTYGSMLEALEREDGFHRGHLHGHRPHCVECATAAKTRDALAFARKVAP